MGYVGGKSITDVSDSSYTDTTRVSAYTYLQGVGVGGPNSAELPPDLALNFDGSRRLEAQGLSYTFRGSNAMQYDSQGRLVWAPANMLTYSQDFSNAAWNNPTNISVTPNADVAPDGSSTAYKLSETVTPSVSHGMRRNFTIPVAGIRQGWSVYVKAAGRNWIWLQANQLTGGGAYFNIAAGTIGTIGTGVSAQIQSVGNGWYRCSVISSAAALNDYISVFFGSSDAFGAYTGDGVSGVLIWGAQWEIAGIDSPKPYNATTSAAYYAPRLDYDPGTLQPKGLFLEEAGTNLLTWSTDLNNGAWARADTTVATSSVIGPDGFPCQSLTEGSAGTAYHQQVAVIPAVTDFVSFSVYLKRGNSDWVRCLVYDGTNGFNAWFNLALGVVGTTSAQNGGTVTAGYIEPVGNGWYRCTAIGKIAVGSTSIVALTCSSSGDGSGTRVSNSIRYEFGPQLESVSGAATRWASSYIPTYGSTATRNADNTPYMTVGSWFNATAGTVVCEYSQPPTPNGGITPPLWSFTTDSNNFIYGYTYPQGQVCGSGIYVKTGGTQLASNNTSISSPYWGCKAAVAFASSDYAVYNGVGASVTTAGAAGSLPTVATMTIGASSAVSTAQTSRWIKSFKYYARRRPNAELQTLADLTQTPQVDLGFLSYGQNQGLLDRRLTWTDRASNATMFDSLGRLVYAPANMLAASQNFTASPWLTAGTGAIAAASVVAPDGTLGASFTQTTSASDYVYQPVVVITGQPYTASIYAKAGTKTTCRVNFSTGSLTNNAYADVNLSSGAITASGTAGTGTLSATSITSVGNGWYRISVSGTMPLTPFYLVVGADSGGAGTIYLWGAQLELTDVTSPKPYIRTETAAVYQPRIDYDPATKTCLGLLLEEARTNLLVRSDDFSNASWLKSGVTVTANSAIAPDGSLTADTVIVNSGAQTYVQLCQDLTALTASASYTVSAYVKKAGAQYAVVGWLYSSGVNGAVSYNLDTQSVSASVGAGGFTITGTSITSVGNGWYRITVTATTPSSANYSRFPCVFPRVTAWTAGAPDAADTGDGVSGLYIWGAQLEAGAFPTSYIPTYGSTATRNADYAPYMPLPYSPNAQLGTYAYSGRISYVASASGAFLLGVSGDSNNYLAPYEIGPSPGIFVRANLATSITNTSSTGIPADNVSFRTAHQFAGTPSVKTTFSGGSVLTTATTPYANSGWVNLSIGSNYATSLVTGRQWISRIRRYHNFAFSDAQLQALGSPYLPIGPA